MCVIAALHGRLLCVMLYSLCKVERIVLTELNEDYYITLVSFIVDAGPVSTAMGDRSRIRVALAPILVLNQRRRPTRLAIPSWAREMSTDETRDHCCRKVHLLHNSRSCSAGSKAAKGMDSLATYLDFYAISAALSLLFIS